MESGGWKVVDGKWWMESGGWKVVDGVLRMETLSRFGVPLSLLVLALFTATHVYLLFVASPSTTP
jgi:hypothetical protein